MKIDIQTGASLETAWPWSAHVIAHMPMHVHVYAHHERHPGAKRTVFYFPALGSRSGPEFNFQPFCLCGAGVPVVQPAPVS